MKPYWVTRYSCTGLTRFAYTTIKKIFAAKACSNNTKTIKIVSKKKKELHCNYWKRGKIAQQCLIIIFRMLPKRKRENTKQLV